MKALTWQGTGKVFVETVPDLRIQEPTDAIVRMTSTATCGSDLHLYDVLGMYLEAGDIIGHKPMGVVEEVGSEVTHHRARRPGGDPVQHLGRIACSGPCDYLHQRCWSTRRRHVGSRGAVRRHADRSGRQEQVEKSGCPRTKLTAETLERRRHDD